MRLWYRTKHRVWDVTYSGNKHFGAIGQMMTGKRIGEKPLFETIIVLITDAYMRHTASII